MFSISSKFGTSSAEESKMSHTTTQLSSSSAALIPREVGDNCNTIKVDMGFAYHLCVYKDRNDTPAAVDLKCKTGSSLSLKVLKQEACCSTFSYFHAASTSPKTCTDGAQTDNINLFDYFSLIHCSFKVSNLTSIHYPHEIRYDYKQGDGGNAGLQKEEVITHVTWLHNMFISMSELFLSWLPL